MRYALLFLFLLFPIFLSYLVWKRGKNEDGKIQFLNEEIGAVLEKILSNDIHFPGEALIKKLNRSYRDIVEKHKEESVNSIISKLHNQFNKDVIEVEKSRERIVVFHLKIYTFLLRDFHSKFHRRFFG